MGPTSECLGSVTPSVPHSWFRGNQRAWAEGGRGRCAGPRGLREVCAPGARHPDNTWQPSLEYRITVYITAATMPWNAHSLGHFEIFSKRDLYWWSHRLENGNRWCNRNRYHATLGGNPPRGLLTFQIPKWNDRHIVGPQAIYIFILPYWYRT